MNVMILSSSKEEIDDYYKSVARSVAGYLASSELDLVYGASSSSMMGICYQEFVKYNRNIYAFTTEKYCDDLRNLPMAKYYIRESTFDMKKAMFEKSDIIVVLPGGIGTLSELLSYIEENRSNDKDIPIEVYDENGYYQELFEMLSLMKNKGFIDEDTINTINISHNKDEFIQHIDNYLIRKRRR